MKFSFRLRSSSIVPTPSGIERKEVLVDGALVSYLQRGELSNSTATFVMLHGLVSSAESFELMMEALPADLHLLAVDLPAISESTGLSEMAMDFRGFSMVVKGFCKALGLRKPILLGHSHGGAIAMDAAYVMDVSRLVLICPAHPFSGREKLVVKFYLSKVGRLFARVIPFLPRFLQDFGIQRMTSRNRRIPRARLDCYRRSMKRTHLFRPMMRLLESWWKDMASLREQLIHDPIAAPTLFLWGEDDMVVPSTTSTDLLKCFKCWEYVGLPQVGHLPNEECPREIAALIRDWLIHSETVRPKLVLNQS